MDKKNFTFGIGLRLLTQVILKLKGLILLPIISNKLGVYNYGVWTQVNVFMNFMLPLLILRLDTACVRFFSSKSEKEIKNDYFSMFNFIVLILGLFSLITFSLRENLSLLLFGNVKEIPIFLYMILFINTRVLYMFTKNYYRFTSDVFLYSIIEIITTFSSFGLGIILLIKGYDLRMFLLALILVEFFSLLFMLFNIIRTIGFSKKIYFLRLKRYLKYSIPLVPNAVLFWITNFSDRILIIKYIDLNQVAVYSANYSIAQLASFLVTPISFMLFPIISEFWDLEKKKKAKTYIEYSVDFYLILAIPSVFGLYYLGPRIMRILSIGQYSVGRNILLFLLLSFFILGLYQIFVYILHLEKRTDLLLGIFLVSSFINISINLIAIPRVGIIGASISTFISFLAQFILVFFNAKKIIFYKFNWIIILKVILSSLIMYFVLFKLDPNNISLIIFSILLCVFIYFLLLFIFNTFKGVEIFKLIKKKR